MPLPRSPRTPRRAGDTRDDDGWRQKLVTIAAAVIAALGYGALSLIPYRPISIDRGTHVETDNVDFRLDSGMKLHLDTKTGLVAARRLHITGIRSIDLPFSAARSGTGVAAKGVALEVLPSSAGPSHLDLDLTRPLPRGTHVWIQAERPDSAGRAFAIALDNDSAALAPVRIQIRGTVMDSVEDGTGRAKERVRGAAFDDSIMLQPHGKLTIEVHLAAGQSIQLTNTIPVRVLGFDNLVTSLSAIRSGELATDGRSLSLVKGDKLHLRHTSMGITHLEFPTAGGMLDVGLTGALRDVAVIRGNKTLGQVPSWYDHLSRRQPALFDHTQQLLGVILIAALTFAFAPRKWIRRWKERRDANN